MYLALIATVLALPFVDLQVFQLGGKSLVLPYLVSIGILVPLFRRPSRLRYVLADPTVPFFFTWIIVACLSSALGYLRHEELFLGYERSELVRHDTTQLLNLLMMFTQYCLYICAMRSLSTRQLNRITAVFIGVGVVGSVYTLYQMGFALFGWPYQDLFRTSNLYLHPATLQANGFGGWVRMPRAFGTAPEPAFWGTYLSIVFAFALGSLRRGHRRIILPAIVMILAAVVATFSRSTWLVVGIIGFAWTASLWTPRITKWLPGGLVAGGALLTLWPTLLVRGSTQLFADLSTLERMSAQLTGLNIVRQNPLFGIGFGSIQFFIEHYAVLLPGYDHIRFITVFSFLLLVFVSTGLLGGAFFWMFLARLALQLRRAFTFSRLQVHASDLRLGTALAFLAVFASWLNQPSYNFSYLWFCLALASVLPGRLAEAEEAPAPAAASAAAAT
jgi:O-Antigen ligase